MSRMFCFLVSSLLCGLEYDDMLKVEKTRFVQFFFVWKCPYKFIHVNICNMHTFMNKRCI